MQLALFGFVSFGSFVVALPGGRANETAKGRTHLPVPPWSEGRADARSTNTEACLERVPRVLEHTKWS